ncbi:MAG: hypothetical protein FWE15_06900 [Actinomycetia bacterium]|jgi:hypothetical protein|nr:hypothetical protein [Actinomycetes bacterium]
MERGNTKHSPARDDQLAHESQAMTQGGAQRDHAEEWREAEPVEDSFPAPDRGTRGWAPDTRDRSELARVMTRDIFPATRERLLRRLDDSDVPPELADRVRNGLTPGRRYGGVHEVLDALGIASPETSGPGTRGSD